MVRPGACPGRLRPRGVHAVRRHGRGYLVGYALSQEDPDGDGVWRLGALYVHPDRWREGIGTALLERVERAAATNGADAMRLVVLADNAVGRSFYEARGYRHEGERGDTLDAEVVEIVYEKALARATGESDP